MNNMIRVFIDLTAAFCSMMSDLINSTDRRAPGCEKKTLELAAQHSFKAFDFDKKKLLAYQGIL
jgi:hypothetical protein